MLKKVPITILVFQGGVLEKKSYIYMASLLCASILTGSQLSIHDIPRMPGSAMKYSKHMGHERLEVEYWIMLADHVAFQESQNQGRVIAKKCIAAMKSMGWSLTKENPQQRGGEFLFRKDVVKEAKITVAPGCAYQEGRKKSHIFIKCSLKLLIPLQDVLGYDYPDIPRFPGSIRIRWMDLFGDYMAKYVVQGSMDKAKKFFQEQLPEHGWQPGRGSGTLNYVKGGYASKKGSTTSRDDIKDPVQMARKLIPGTLSIHLKEEEGIIEIGIGRSARSGEGIKLSPTDITPLEKPPIQPEKVLTFVEIEKELSFFPGLKIKSQENLPVNVRGEEIIRLSMEIDQAVPHTALEMAAFFLNEMKQKNWDLVEDRWHGLGRRMNFCKGAILVKISIKAIGRYPIPESAAKNKINIPVRVDVVLPIPLKETAGKDIEKVPRFPNSVRYYYLEAATDHMVKYKAAASVKQVERFFLRKLPEEGWRFAGYDSTGLLFVPVDTAQSASSAPAKGKLVPTTLKLKVDDMWNNTVKIGLTRTRGD
jgi:hypothetical protein